MQQYGLSFYEDKCVFRIVAGCLLLLAASGCSANQQTEIPDQLKAERPAHHGDGTFRNLYLPDNHQPSSLAFLQARFLDDQAWPDEPQNHKKYWQKTDPDSIKQPDTEPRATLIGHSTVLLQYQGTNILTDPIFSDRASPFSFAGPKRYTQTSIGIEDLPPIDIVVISHNHYDHLDVATVRALGDEVHWLVPLGLKDWFAQFDVTNVTELDWWQSHVVDGVEIQALPSQHWSRRGLFDTNKSLWASWAFKWDNFTAWFGGDTGYNDVQFKEIGEALGRVDLAMIPIGAYEPRWFMKYHHVNPDDAVKIFKDINAQSAFGIHWNTFVLTAEAVDAPPKALAAALQLNQINPQRFQAINIGATWIAKKSPESVAQQQ